MKYLKNNTDRLKSIQTTEHHDNKTGGDIGVKHEVPEEQHRQVKKYPNNLIS